MGCNRRLHRIGQFIHVTANRMGEHIAGLRIHHNILVKGNRKLNLLVRLGIFQRMVWIRNVLAVEVVFRPQFPFRKALLGVGDAEFRLVVAHVIGKVRAQDQLACLLEENSLVRVNLITTLYPVIIGQICGHHCKIIAAICREHKVGQVLHCAVLRLIFKVIWIQGIHPFIRQADTAKSIFLRHLIHWYAGQYFLGGAGHLDIITVEPLFINVLIGNGLCNLIGGVFLILHKRQLAVGLVSRKYRPAHAF